MTNHSHGTAFMTSVITATVALVPSGTFNYVEKLLSVFVLAMAAEVGRRLIALAADRIWRKK